MTEPQTERKRLLIATTVSDMPEVAIFSGLIDAGLDVHIICDPDAHEITQLGAAGAHITEAKLKRMPRSRATQLVKDYIQTHSIEAVYAPRRFSLDICIRAVGQSDVRLVGYRGTTGHLGLFDLGPRLAYTNKRVDKIACVSNAVKEHLLEVGIPESKLDTIYKGHDINWYKPCERSVLTELGVPADAFVVGFCGRVRTVKGVRYLVESLRMIPADLNVHILIAGQMDDRTVRRMAASPEFRDRIHCAGFRKDATSLMGACDVFAMPSLKREGMPKALIEAMAQGVPSVAARAGGIPEIIEDGISGTICEPKDAKGIADAITHLAQNSEAAAEMGRNAQKRIQDHFSIDATVANMKQLFFG